MVRQVKIVVLGTLGLVTALVCAFALVRRPKKAVRGKSHSASTTTPTPTLDTTPAPTPPNSNTNSDLTPSFKAKAVQDVAPTERPSSSPLPSMSMPPGTLLNNSEANPAENAPRKEVGGVAAAKNTPSKSLGWAFSAAPIKKVGVADASRVPGDDDGEKRCAGGGARRPAEEAGRGTDGGKEEGVDTIVARFNKANSMAKKFFKAHLFDRSAEQYGVALSFCDQLPDHDDKRTALHNNRRCSCHSLRTSCALSFVVRASSYLRPRYVSFSLSLSFSCRSLSRLGGRGAAFEKSGKYALSLTECTMCLARDPNHPLARVRKSRVLEVLGKHDEALAEVCAHLLLERDRFEAKAMLNPSLKSSPPNPPPNLEGLLEKIAKSRAEEILGERKKAAEEEAEASGGRRAKPKPLVKQTVTELLRSFGSFNQMERRYEDINESALTRELRARHGEADAAARPGAGAREGEGEGKGGSPPVVNNALPGLVSTMLDRAMLRLVKKSYDGAREDILDAVEVLSGMRSTSGAEGIGVSPEVQAAVWEWKGTFLQLGLELDGAMEAYERAVAVMEAEGQPAPADVMIKMAYTHLDKGENGKARALFDRAINEHPDYGSTYAHRSRMELTDGGSHVKVLNLLEKALALSSSDVYSWESMAKLQVQMGELDKAWATTNEAMRFVPNAEALYVLKAELKFSLAARTGDASAGPEIIAIFEEGIRAHPLSQQLYISKAVCLLQMMRDMPGATKALERAVAVDPTNPSGFVQLANLKVMAAKSLEDAEAVAVILQKAVDLSTTQENLADALGVLAATRGRMNGAMLLGRSTFS